MLVFAGTFQADQQELGPIQRGSGMHVAYIHVRKRHLMWRLRIATLVISCLGIERQTLAVDTSRALSRGFFSKRGDQCGHLRSATHGVAGEFGCSEKLLLRNDER
jgi:hypothetical protein